MRLPPPPLMLMLLLLLPRQFLLHTTNEGFQAHHSATRQGVAGVDAACIALEAIHKELNGDE